MCLATLVLLGARAGAQTTVHLQDFNSSLSPWSEYRPSETTADWSLVSSSSYPSCSPQEGAQMAKFNSYSATSGDWARLESPALDLTGAEVAEVRFWMYRDTTESGSQDEVQVQISTDGGDSFWSQVRFVRPGASNGWEEKVVPLGYYTDRTNLRLGLTGVSRYGANLYLDNLRVTKAVLAARVDGKACTTNADCDSGHCGPDPDGNLRCRPAASACVDGNRVGVSAGTLKCHGADVAVCNTTDSWTVTSCQDDCGPYLDVHGCSLGECADCEMVCIPWLDQGCDSTAYCEGLFIGQCIFKKADGLACGANGECLSGNCVAAPGGAHYCEAAGVRCAAADGSPATVGDRACASGDLYTCGSSGWTVQDCYTNCGFYLDVDTCAAGACATCAVSCSNNVDCKPGILCTGNACVGDLPLGTTCQLDSQCGSDHCIDGRCCQDVCTAACHRCDVDTSGICRPLPTGSDPDGECAGSGPCGGACNGAGTCAYPGSDTACDVCTRCDGHGACASFNTAGTDPADECPRCQVCRGDGPGCALVGAGLDLLDECAESPAEGCGLDGNCDGAGACRYWAAGTACGPSSCQGGMEQPADACDGAGRCVDGGSRSCGLYRCADATRCATGCTGHAACVPAGYCSLGGQCEPDLGTGEACAGVVWPGEVDDAACAGGYCFDDNFDGNGAFCTAAPAGCVHDGLDFTAGYALCSGDDWYKVCRGGALGWGEAVDCAAGLCDAGGGAGSGYREAGLCISGPGGGCSSSCHSCEPYLAEAVGACGTVCDGDTDCWTGYVCHDNACQVPEGIGQPCAGQGDCPAGWCVDGRCCLESCLGACRACNLPGHEGFCSPAAAGSDPDEDCPAQLAGTCGTTGVCDGEGACTLWPAGTACAAAGCQGSELLGAATCDGVGGCAPGLVTDCRPGRCAGGACRDDCATHSDCDPSGYCGPAGLCLADLDPGDLCSDAAFEGLEDGAACLGGWCFEDNFSESGQDYCGGAIDDCTAAGAAYPVGTFLCNADDWVRVCLGGGFGWGPEVACQPAGLCDAGSGPDSGVTAAEHCESGVQGGCRTACLSCLPYRAEVPGQCAQTCAEDADCWPGMECLGDVCQPATGLSATCQTEADCAGWSCVDGVCCNLPCDGICTSCSEPLARGLCLNVAAGTDPAGDCQPDGTPCGSSGECNGRGACALAPAGSECQPAACQDGVYTSAAFCDGRGGCVPGQEHACPSGRCDADRCAAEMSDGGSDGGDGGGDAMPVAEAGPPQRVAPFEMVVLDGSGSRDPDGAELDFLWEQSSGPESVALSGGTTARPSFVPRVEGVYAFRLEVDDGTQTSAPDFVEVTVSSAPAGCGCAAGGAGGAGLLGPALLWFWVRRRRR